MPNIQSAWKRMRQSQERRSRNRAEKATLKTLQTRVYDETPAVPGETREQTFRRYCSFLDKAVKKGIIMANTASRRKSRAARRLAVAAAAIPKA